MYIRLSSEKTKNKALSGTQSIVVKYRLTEVNKLPLWLACLIPVPLGFLINRIARLLYEPYLPCCDPTYSGAQFTAASERACIWIMVGIIVTDLFYTRKLHLTKWSGRVSYALMWLVLLYPTKL